MAYRGNRCQVCTGCGRCAPGGSLENEMKVVTSSFLLPERMDLQQESVRPQEAAGQYPGRELAIADLGTTTIAMEWYDGRGKSRGNMCVPIPRGYLGRT